MIPVSGFLKAKSWRKEQSEKLNTDRAAQMSVKHCQALSLLFAALIFLALSVDAHVPLMAKENDNISQAMIISDTAKSWAVYGSLPDGETRYFAFDIQKGERIYLSLFKSADRNEIDFQPELVLIGPGLAEDRMPAGLSTLPPALSGLKALEAERKVGGNLASINSASTNSASINSTSINTTSISSASINSTSAVATYEPFGPSSYVELAEINITAPESGRYYAAVHGNFTRFDGVGHYGLTVGYREETSFSDRMSTPIQLISVYLWEGQSLGVILIPYMVAEIVALLFFLRGSRRTSFCLAGMLAGFLFLATSAVVINQMVFSLIRAPFGPEVYITVLIAFFHALLGVGAIRLSRGEAGILQRALLAVIGTLALLAGSGLVMGPILSIAASFLPSKSGSIFGRSAEDATE